MNLSNAIQAIENGQLDEKFQKLYIEKNRIQNQKDRYIQALKTFEQLYGDKDVSLYSAPGRTEIGGNHTDHQNGKVLAGAINLDVIGVVTPRDDMVVRLFAEGFAPIEIGLHNLNPNKDEYGTTTGLIRGVAAGFIKRGYKIGGFEAYVTSDVLVGSGLSSSAAFEVLMGNVFSDLYNQESVDAVTIAQIGQEAENLFFGKPCGLMDQMACSVGSLTYIDFANPQQPVVQKVKVDFSDYEHCLCIVDTKGSHADLTDEYAAIPNEMKSVAAHFGKEVLRQVEKDVFYQNLAEVRQTCGDRAVLRSMHWFGENDRVEAQVQALKNKDMEGFKKLVKASGDSSFKFLQNVYATKNPVEQKLSLGLAVSEQILKEQGVCRVHGGGFAGTIQAFVPVATVAMYKLAMEHLFGEGTCQVLQIRSEGGVKIIG